MVNLHKLLIPLVDIGGLLTVVRILVVSRRGVVAMVLAPLDDFSEYSLVDLRDIVNPHFIRNRRGRVKGGGWMKKALCIAWAVSLGEGLRSGWGWAG